MNVRRLLALSLAALAACAEETPGVGPPSDQLHYPGGLALARGATPADDRLIVGNTNFDQRYNAGSLMSLSVDALFAAVAGVNAADPYTDQIPISGFTRIPSFGGDIVTATAGFGGGTRIYIPARGKNLLITAELDVATGKITCERPDHPVRTGTAAAFDCDDRHFISTDGSDAYSLAYAPPRQSGTKNGLLAVGHLRPNPASRSEVFGDLSLVNLETFEERANGAVAGAERLSGLRRFAFDGIPGITGVAYVPAGIIAPGRGQFLVAGRNFTAQRSVAVVSYTISGTTAYELTTAAGVEIGNELRAFRLRSLTLAPEGDRAYVSVHLPETVSGSGSSANSAIAVLGLDASGVRLLGALEIGEELGRPVVYDHPRRGRLVYVPDLRTDVIWIVDASTDRPTIAGAIRGDRPVAGSTPPLRRELLQTPTSIVFATRGGRALGFVTNFGSSTLAAIDVTDPDPTRHFVAARLGRVLNPDGTTGDKHEEK